MTMPFEIRWAREIDGAAVAAIWRDARSWLESIGQPMWATADFSDCSAAMLANAGRLVVGAVGGTIAACMTLTDSDPLIWPAEIHGAALYVHKLAVARTQAGEGWSQAMLDWAAAAATARGISVVRLDCAPRPELLRLYLKCGFTRLDPEPNCVGGFPIVRFERRTDAPRS